MASTKEYLNYVLEQLSELEDITYRMMMGEYLLYFKGKLFGGIYDNRFLVKSVKSAVSIMPEPIYEIPYDGAKPMLLVTETEDMEFLKKLLEAMYNELLEPKKKQR